MKLEATTTKKKRITLDDLAAMLKREFDRIDVRFDALPTIFATKDEVREIVREEMRPSEERLHMIEDVVYSDHRFRIRALEREVGID